MKILVSGAAGFIGFHLCKSLLKKGHIIIGIDNLNSYYDIDLKYARLSELGINRNDAKTFLNQCKGEYYKGSFQFIKMNLEDRSALPDLFKQNKFDVVINLAAQAGVRYSIENPSAYIDSNIVGFLNILECCRNNNIKHLFYASSSSVYGENKKVPFSTTDNVDHPISLYAATKKSNELMAHTYSHLYNLPTTGLRFFTVYGPWGRPDMAPMLFSDAISNGNPIKIFNNGYLSRDFTYIDDIISGVELLLTNLVEKSKEDSMYRIFNIGNGCPVSLLDFVKTLENKFGKKAHKEYISMQPGDVPQTWADITEMEKIGYKANTQLDEGLYNFVKWFKSYKNLN